MAEVIQQDGFIKRLEMSIGRHCVYGFMYFGVDLSRETNRKIIAYEGTKHSVIFADSEE